MLKNINPLLNPDVLQVLAAMGHGDTLVLADANFPSQSVAKTTTHGTVLRMDGANVVDAADAVLSLMPLDTFIDNAAQCMEVVDDPNAQPDVQQEVQAKINHHEGEGFKLSPVERFAFYDKASTSYAILATSERRFYGCFILTKGVVPPEV